MGTPFWFKQHVALIVDDHEKVRRLILRTTLMKRPQNASFKKRFAVFFYFLFI